MPTITQQKKKQKTMLIALGLVIVLIVVILIWGLGGGREAPRDAGEEFVSEDIISEAAIVIIRDIFIPRDFFKDGLLKHFSSYEPIAPPTEKGRDNPFAPIISE